MLIQGQKVIFCLLTALLSAAVLSGSEKAEPKKKIVDHRPAVIPLYDRTYAPKEAPKRYDPGAKTSTPHGDAPLARTVGGRGNIKLGSAPIQCVVTFRGNRYTKEKAILRIPDVPAGRYTVQFIDPASGRVLHKEVTVKPNKTAIVFGNLHGKYSKKATVPGWESGRQVPERPRAVRLGDGKRNQDAQDAFALAETQRRSINPFKKSDRYRDAERLYKKILKRWPNSRYTEDCHFQLGAIYESVFYRTYEKAIKEYKDVLRLNTHTRFQVRWRIAVLYENRLFQKTQGRQWYEVCARRSPDEKIRKKAARRAAALKERGF